MQFLLVTGGLILMTEQQLLLLYYIVDKKLYLVLAVRLLKDSIRTKRINKREKSPNNPLSQK